MSKELDAVLYLEEEEPASTSRGAPLLVWLLALASAYTIGVGSAYATSVAYFFAFM